MVKPIHTEAWSVSENQFPEGGTDEEKLIFCVRYAILAPSQYNTQPWHFDIKNGAVCVYADRRYALAVIDPDDRGLVISCAAAVFNLRLAIRYFGYSEKVDYTPDPSDENLIARITIGEKFESEDGADDTEDHALFKAMKSFEYNHNVFQDKPLKESDLNALKAAASAEGVWLYVCDDVEKKNVARVVAEAGQMQIMSKNYRREFASWTDERRAISGDGLPEYARSFTENMNSFTPHIARLYRNKEGQAVSAQELLETLPCLAILGSQSGGAPDRIQTGQGLMRLCLTAAARGISVSMLNQPCEVPEMRLRLHDEISQQGRAHIVLRFGYGAKPELHGRRPLRNVLRVNGKAYRAEDFSNHSTKAAKKSFFRRFW